MAGQELDGQDEGEATATLARPAAYCQLRFVGVSVALPSTTPVVALEEIDPPYRRLEIPVGMAEGVAIAHAAGPVPTPKPLTHELMTAFLEAFGLVLEVVRITDVAGAAFSGELVVSGPAGGRTIPCRPSDGIALALRQRLFVPVVAASRVLEVAGTAPEGPEPAEPEPAEPEPGATDEDVLEGGPGSGS